MPRNFQLTLNKIDEWESICKYLCSLSYQYIIACKEIAPTTGHEHIHVYIQLKVNLNKLSKKKLLTAHIEKCFGSPQKNIDYIRKDGNIIFEAGKPKLVGKISIEDAKKMDKLEREKLPLFYLRAVNKINQDELNVMNAYTYLKDIKVYYIYGESGIGKTKWVIDKIKELYTEKKIESADFNELKYSNGFWCGVDIDNIKKVALYDDFRDSHMKPSEFINFIDYNTHNLNIKYGNVKNIYEYIFITSIQSPYDIYSEYNKKNEFENADEEPKKQWLRRFTEIIKIE